MQDLHEAKVYNVFDDIMFPNISEFLSLDRSVDQISMFLLIYIYIIWRKNYLRGMSFELVIYSFIKQVVYILDTSQHYRQGIKRKY